MSETRQPKRFDISDVLSITHERLVSTRHMTGVYEILNHLTGESLFTHALPRAARVCAPVLLKRFPALAADSAAHVDTTNWREWLAEMRAKHGDSFDIEPLSPGEYKALDPLAEPILDGKRVITVTAASPS